MSDVQSRHLTPHERWFLMRRNARHQFTITVLISYPVAVLPSQAHLLGRIMDLQHHFKQLSCRLRDAKTRRPYWQEGPVRTDILNEKVYTEEKDEGVIAQEQRRMGTADEDRPLWQVTPYESQSKGYLAISALHELIDGRGLLRLVHGLLNDVDFPYEDLASVTTYPDSVNIQPSWRFLLPFALQEKVYPWLPRWITPYPSTAWPIGQVRVNPLTLPGKTILLDLPHDLVTSLKSVGRFHGVPTLTPTLFTAWLVAMWTVTKSPSLSATIAVDERKAELGHSYCTGLYHASHFYSMQFPSTSFWNVARSVALHIAHPNSLTTARMRMGMIAWVPDGEVPASRRQDDRPTAWEDWQLQRNENLAPYVASASFSNLGRVDLPEGADGIVVVSSASVGDPPIKLVLTGTKDIKVAITFRDGDILTEAQVEEMGKGWVGMLQQLVSGNGEDVDLGGERLLGRGY